MNKTGITLSVVGGLALVVALAVGGYQLGWWLRADTVNRTTAIDQNSLSRQESARIEIADGAIDVAALDTQIATDPANAGAYAAQRRAVVERTCTSARAIRGPVSSDIAAFAAVECNVTLEVQQ